MVKHFKKFISINLAVITIWFFGVNGLTAKAFNKSTANSIASTSVIDALSAKSFATVHFATGKVVVESETSKDHFSVGNMIKLMTLYLTFEAVDKGETKLTTYFPVSKNAQKISEGRTRVFLDAGKDEVITVEEAVIAVCVGSAEDAAYALAEHISGGTEAEFVEMMNNKAKELGMDNTKFLDSTGIKIISDGQYSCARDMAVLSYNLVNNYPDVLKYTTIMSGKFEHTSTGQPATNMSSSNALISSGMFPECDGLLVGYSKADLYAQAATAKIEDERIVAVVIGEETPEKRAGELKFLMEYTAKTFEMSEPELAGTYVRQISVKEGKKLKVKTATGGDFSFLENSSEKYTIEKKIVIDKELYAPVSKGQKVGSVIYQKVTVDENNEKVYEDLGTVDLVADEDIPKANWFTLLIRKILSWFGIGNY